MAVLPVLVLLALCAMLAIDVSIFPTTPEALMRIADTFGPPHKLDLCDACGTIINSIDQANVYMQNHLYTVGEYTPVFADHVKAKTPEAIRSNILHSCLQEKHASQQSCVSLLTKSESETAAFADTVINIAINDNGLVTINDVSLHWHNPEVAVPMVEMARSYLQEYPLRAGPLGFIKGAKPKESPIINHVAPMAATKNIDEHYMTTLWYLQHPLDKTKVKYCYRFCEGSLDVLERWKVYFLRWYAVNNVSHHLKRVGENPLFLVCLIVFVCCVFVSLTGINSSDGINAKNPSIPTPPAPIGSSTTNDALNAARNNRAKGRKRN